MAGEGKLHPPIMWAQRPDVVYLTINLEDCKDPLIELKEDSLHFRAVGGPEKKEYEITLEFYAAVDTKQSKYNVEPRHIPMVLYKKEEGPFWPRLLKEKVKAHWLKTDFDKWKDEDDSDNEQSKEPDLSEMMSRMGNFNPSDAAADFGQEDDEQDSDDEDLPDLEA